MNPGDWVACSGVQYVIVSVEQRSRLKRWVLRNATDNGERFRLDANEPGWNSKPSKIRK